MNHISPAATGSPVAPVVFGEPVPAPRGSGPPGSTAVHPSTDAPSATRPDRVTQAARPTPTADAPDTLGAPIFHYVDREIRDWTLPTLTQGFDAARPVADGESIFSDELPTISFAGVLLAVSTTRRPVHTCDPEVEITPRSVRCSACRWFETRIFRLVDHDAQVLQGMRYALHYVGRSIVPGEVDLPRYELVSGGHGVVEAYIVRKEGQAPFITKPGARVLAQAAQSDPDIEDAYINRATA